LAQQTATQKQGLIQLVIYDLPNRDCNALASNGELAISHNGFARYKSEFIDPIVTILKSAEYASLRIVTLIEVDSLPNLITNPNVPKCQEAAGPGGYIDGVTYALDQLAPLTNVYNYIDIGHSGWLGWDDNRTRSITQLVGLIQGTTLKWGSVAGFASNSANYTPLEEPNLADPNAMVSGNPLRSANFYQWNPHFDELDYATAMRAAFLAAGAPTRLGMLIDTGRNGWGGANRPTTASGANVNDVVSIGRVDRRLHRGNWCNQASAGVGERPVSAPKPGIHAYVWVKPPGESDGISTPTSGPNADGKQHDPMCDPTFIGSQNSNGGNLTGAMTGAPHAGSWFSEHFRSLVQNAYPAL
jgi:cellulose 1,4-beta-cellobiosidase